MEELTHTLVYVRGTWEGPEGMDRGLMDRLEQRRPGKYRLKRVIYPADYAKGMTYNKSRLMGEEATVKLIREDELPVVLVGYSQGGHIAGNVAKRVAEDPDTDLVIDGVGLFADPARAHAQYLWDLEAERQGLRPKGYGITGQRWILESEAMRVWQIFARDDGIADLPDGNPLRGLADLSAAFSSRPEDAAPWVVDVALKIARRQAQEWWDPRKRDGWKGAAAYLEGYLHGGRHTAAYWNEGHVDRLADAIAADIP